MIIPNNKFVIVIKYLKIMETASSFALPNQFLVYKAKKILVQCDLDIVLIEHYEQSLESWQKNREIIEKELIDLIRL